MKRVASILKLIFHFKLIYFRNKCVEFERKGNTTFKFPTSTKKCFMTNPVMYYFDDFGIL